MDCRRPRSEIVRRLPPICPSCKAVLTGWPDEHAVGKKPGGRVCGACGYLLDDAELERQADELAAALFEELEE